MMSVVLGGPELSDFSLSEPAASVRVLLPSMPGVDVAIPVWRGNEFLLPNGQTVDFVQVGHTTTLSAVRSATNFVDLANSGFAVGEQPRSATLAMSGPGRGYPSIRTQLASCSSGTRPRSPYRAAPGVDATPMAVECTSRSGREAELRSRCGATLITWHSRRTRSRRRARHGSRLVGDAGRLEDLGRRKAAACTASGITFFDSSACAPATVRGYWKHGRAGDAD
jgi:hypothetical protein